MNQKVWIRCGNSELVRETLTRLGGKIGNPNHFRLESSNPQRLAYIDPVSKYIRTVLDMDVQASWLMEAWDELKDLPGTVYICGGDDFLILLSDDGDSLEFQDSSGDILTFSKKLDYLRPASSSEIDHWNRVLHCRSEGYRKHYSRSSQKIVPWFEEYDRVLVRDSEDQRWRIGIFSHHDKAGYHIFGSDNLINDIIPFNEETKKLLQ